MFGGVEGLLDAGLGPHHLRKGKWGVTVPMGGGGGSGNVFLIDFDLSVVIDPEQGASFSLGD